MDWRVKCVYLAVLDKKYKNLHGPTDLFFKLGTIFGTVNSKYKNLTDAIDFLRSLIRRST